MEHSDWLDNALRKIDTIHQQIGVLTDNTNTIKDQVLQLRQVSEPLLSRINTRGKRDSLLHLIHIDTRSALENATDLSHESEIVLKANYFIQQFGINLENIFAGDIHVGPGGQARVSQRDTAVLTSRTGSTRDQAVSDGELGICIPLVMEMLGQYIEFDLDTNASLVRETSSNRFRFLRSRGAHMDKLVMTRTVTRLVREHADQELATRLTRTLPPLPSVNLGLGEPHFYSSAFDGEANLMRFFGTYGRRKRKRTSRIDQLPDWGQVGIKTSSDVFVKMVHDQIRAAGLSPGSVDFIGNGRFRTAATATSSNTKRILCTDFGATVRITFFIEGHIFPTGPSSLKLQVREYRSADPDIEYHPRAVDFLLRWADDFVEDMIAAMAPAVRFERNFYVPGARRIKVDINSERFLAYIALN